MQHINQHGLIYPKKQCHWLYGKDSDNPNNYAKADCQIYEHLKQAVGFFFVTFTKGFTDKSASAGANHKAHTAENHDIRHNKIDCGKCSLACKVRNKKTVNHAKYGCEHHHQD